MKTLLFIILITGSLALFAKGKSPVGDRQAKSKSSVGDRQAKSKSPVGDRQAQAAVGDEHGLPGDCCEAYYTEAGLHAEPDPSSFANEVLNSGEKKKGSNEGTR